jgi:hypothetical protein
MSVKVGQRCQSDKTFHTKSQEALVKTACSMRAISDLRFVGHKSGVRPRLGLDKNLILCATPF